VGGKETRENRISVRKGVSFQENISKNQKRSGRKKKLSKEVVGGTVRLAEYTGKKGDVFP